jgi:hypothetical protein
VCSSDLLGGHDLELAKDGFMDIKERVEIVEGGVKTARALPRTDVEIKAKPTKGKSLALAKAKAIDLLPLVRPEKHGFPGKWTLRNGLLYAEGGKIMICTLPYKPPEEYDFKIVFTRFNGQHVVQMLAVGSNAFIWAMDESAKGLYAFQMVNEKHMSDDNPTKTSLGSLPNGQKCTSVVQVRKNGVTAYLNGRLVCQHKTDYNDLSIASWWRVVEKGCIGVGCFSGQFAFHEIVVEEVSGTGEVLK